MHTENKGLVSKCKGYVSKGSLYLYDKLKNFAEKLWWMGRKAIVYVMDESFNFVFEVYLALNCNLNVSHVFPNKRKAQRELKIVYCNGNVWLHI